MSNESTTATAAPLDAAWRAAYGEAVLLPGWSSGRVTLIGPDGLRFSNSMFTQRFDDLAVAGRRASAYCDAKGRMLGLLELWRVEDHSLVVLLDGASDESFEARYGRYIVLDDVELEVVTEELEHLTLLGPTAAAAASSAGVELGATETVVAFDGGWALLGTRLGHPVVELVLTRTAAHALRERLSGVVVADEALWERLRVEAGAPRWPVDMSDKEMVHTMGLREEVLHFEKGCYIGQETIHRLDVMGKLRKRFGALVAQGPIAVGDEVHHAGKKVGVLTTVLDHPQSGWVGLAVLRDPGSTPGEELIVRAAHGDTAATAVERPVPNAAPS